MFVVTEPQVVIMVFHHVTDAVVSLREVFDEMLSIVVNIISDALLVQSEEISVSIADTRNVSELGWTSMVSPGPCFRAYFGSFFKEK